MPISYYLGLLQNYYQFEVLMYLLSFDKIIKFCFLIYGPQFYEMVNMPHFTYEKYWGLKRLGNLSKLNRSEALEIKFEFKSVWV